MWENSMERAVDTKKGLSKNGEGIRQKMRRQQHRTVGGRGIRRVLESRTASLPLSAVPCG